MACTAHIVCIVPNHIVSCVRIVRWKCYNVYLYIIVVAPSVGGAAKLRNCYSTLLNGCAFSLSKYVQAEEKRNRCQSFVRTIRFGNCVETSKCNVSLLIRIIFRSILFFAVVISQALTVQKKMETLNV